jgi:hypothetical protein
MLARCAPFCGITRRRVVIIKRDIITRDDYQSPPSSSPLYIVVRLAGFLFFLDLTLKDGTDTFSRNVSKQLPHDAA